IRESVEQAHAERIGHGVDVLHEDDSAGLLKEMAARRILVEICLSSNDLILGVRGKDHPLNTYLEYGVPTALATDDEGVSRSNMTNEYVRAVDDQGLTYGQLKKMARASLEYSFASGSSLWEDPTTSMPVSDCAADLHRLSKGAHRSLSASCRSYLDANLKAELQWSLEEKFLQFEQSVVGRGNH
ncbi:MAG TPA: adenosine deaminase, partial [Blastocatellia bacterium]|nr:adenosine deaminase [Blastocatellia bacterium]